MHYLPEQIEAWAARQRAPRIVISDERGEILDTGGGIARALPLLGPDPFFVLNSDSFWIDRGVPALQRLRAAWNDAAMDCLLLLCPLERTVGYDGQGDFVIGSDGRLARRAQSPGTPLAYIGGYLVAPRLFADAPAGKFSMNLLWDRAIAKGRLHGIAHEGLLAACGNAGRHRAGRSADEGLGRWRPPRHGSSPSRRTGPFSMSWPRPCWPDFPSKLPVRQRPWNSRAGPSCCPPAARCANSSRSSSRRAAARGLLLPAIRPIGDIDEDTLGGNEPGIGADIPDAMSGTAQLLLLIDLIDDWARANPQTRLAQEVAAAPHQAAALALSLQEFLDAIETEEVDAALIPGLYDLENRAPPRGHPRIPVDRARTLSGAA